MLTGVEKLSSVELPDVQRVVESIVRASLNIRYVDTVAKAEKVQLGEIVLLDTGVTKRIYMRTGKDNVVYFTGT